ncbi:MAG: hypothetical protein RSA99_04685 [Oscillospiraceae bacterium]
MQIKKTATSNNSFDTEYNRGVFDLSHAVIDLNPVETPKIHIIKITTFDNNMKKVSLLTIG